MTLELNGLSIPADLADVMERLARVGADLARMIARNGIEGDLEASAGVNSDGDGQ